MVIAYSFYDLQLPLAVQALHHAPVGHGPDAFQPVSHPGLQDETLGNGQEAVVPFTVEVGSVSALAALEIYFSELLAVGQDV